VEPAGRREGRAGERDLAVLHDERAAARRGQGESSVDGRRSTRRREAQRTRPVRALDAAGTERERGVQVGAREEAGARQADLAEEALDVEPAALHEELHGERGVLEARQA